MATQTERREATRAALLDAAVEALVESGIAGFTTADVGRRASLSNGALFRHFPTKNDLVAATVEHVFDRLRDEYEAAFVSLDTDRRTIPNLLDLLWQVMSDPALAAVYEVYTSARTDAWMQAAIEPIVIDHMDRLQQLGQTVVAQALADHVGDFPTADVIQAIVLAMQGLVINLMARPDPDASDHLIAGLTQLASLIGAPA